MAAASSTAPDLRNTPENGTDRRFLRSRSMGSPASVYAILKSIPRPDPGFGRDAGPSPSGRAGALPDFPPSPIHSNRLPARHSWPPHTLILGNPPDPPPPIQRPNSGRARPARPESGWQTASWRVTSPSGGWLIIRGPEHRSDMWTLPACDAGGTVSRSHHGDLFSPSYFSALLVPGQPRLTALL